MSWTCARGWSVGKPTSYFSPPLFTDLYGNHTMTKTVEFFFDFGSPYTYLA